jgi:hypothetical protein
MRQWQSTFPALLFTRLHANRKALAEIGKQALNRLQTGLLIAGLEE